MVYPAVNREFSAVSAIKGIEMSLEDQDRRILSALQSDGRLSNQTLAERVSMSASACWRRVRALENSGLIQRYTAIVNAPKAGLSFHAIVLVQIARHDSSFMQNFISQVIRRLEVLECFATTGEADYHLRVRCRNLDAYNAFLDDFLFRLPGVANVRTNFILKEIKNETRLDLNSG